MKAALKAAWQAGWRAPDRRPIYEWAEDEVKLPPAFTKNGPFRISASRHFIFPFVGLQHDRVREENIMAPVRGGKTLIADIWLPWTLKNDPGPFRWVSQTDQNAKEHAEIRTLPILESVEGIRDLMPGGDRQRTQEIIFTNGIPFYIQGPAPTKLQNKGYRYMVGDEPWQYKPGTIGEIKGRVGDFLKMNISKILFISQGGDPDDEWTEQFDTGILFPWNVQCAKCDKYMTTDWSNTRDNGSFWGMVWDQHKLPNGDWDIAKAVPTARFECRHCGHPHVDNARTKSEWNRTGTYPKMDLLPEKISIAWNAVIDTPWTFLVENWLHACNALNRGNVTLKIQFYQKYLAKSMNEQRVLQQAMIFARVAYDILTDWPEEVVRFMAIDRQEEDVYWWTVRTWSSTGRSRRLGFGKAFGTAELEKLREQFKVQPNNTFVDSAYNPKGDHGVYAACIRFGWIAVRGEDRDYFVHWVGKGKNRASIARSYSEVTFGDPESGNTGQGRAYAPVICFSKPVMNGRVQGLIDKGFWEEPSIGDPRLEKEYAIQMANRFRKVRRDTRTGRETVIWFEAKNDHARDLANIETFAATAYGDILPDTLDAVGLSSGLAKPAETTA